MGWEKHHCGSGRCLKQWFRGKRFMLYSWNCVENKSLEYLSDYIMLPSFEEVKNDKYTYAKSFHIQHENIDAIAAKILVEPYDGWYVVQNSATFATNTG